VLQSSLERADRQILRSKTIRLSSTLVKAFAVLVLFLSTGALIPLLTDTEDLAQGNPVNQALWLGVYGITSLLIVMRWRRFVQVAARDKLLLLLVGLALVSVLWSVAPAITLRRDVALLGTTLFGIYFGMRYEPKEQLWLLAWALGVVGVLSLMFSLALPSYGLDSDGSWQGVFGGGKNVLGRASALSALVFSLLAFGARKYRWAAWSGFGLSSGLLLLSNSITSMVSLLIVLVLLPFFRTLRGHHTLAASFFIAVILVGGGAAMWVTANETTVLNVMGRDATLSNRTVLWPAVIEMIKQRPWLGYGYGAFWLGWSGESAQVWLWTARVGLEAVHAHNGLLELGLNLGLLGVSTFMFGFVVATRRAVSWVRSTKAVEGLWPLAFLTLMTLYNLTEPTILVHGNAYWILYVAVVVSTAARLAKGREIDNLDTSLRKTSATVKRSSRA
jgi:exopolysaccharide production protein ExoQ